MQGYWNWTNQLVLIVRKLLIFNIFVKVNGKFIKMLINNANIIVIPIDASRVGINND